MKNTKTALAVTLWAVIQAGKRHYTTMSCDRGLELLDKYHDVKIKRRWYFECTKDLEAEGLIARKQRYRQNNTGQISQLPPLTSFTLKGLKELVKLKVTGAFRALKEMLVWVKAKDNRFPRPEDLMPSLSMEERNENIRRLKKLFKNIG